MPDASASEVPSTTPALSNAAVARAISMSEGFLMAYKLPQFPTTVVDYMPTQTPAGPASKVLLPSVRARGAAHVWRLHPPGFPRGNLPRAAMRDPRLLHLSLI